MHRGSQGEKRESSRLRVESLRDAPAALEMTSDPQLREQSHQGEEVEILNLKQSKLQKRRLPRRPPAQCRPCRASSTVSPAFCTIWSQLTSANEAKSNKSVPPQQHTRLPAARGSLCQDTDGMGERSACIPENALAEKLITHPVPPTIRKGCGKANRSIGKGRAPHQQTLVSLLWLHIQTPWNSQNALETPPGISQLCFFFGFFSSPLLDLDRTSSSQDL